VRAEGEKSRSGRIASSNKLEFASRPQPTGRIDCAAQKREGVEEKIFLPWLEVLKKKSSSFAPHRGSAAGIKMEKG